MKKIVGIIPPMASPISSPFNSYISPSMHAFSQGTQEGNKEGKMDSNNISKIALIVACITFGVVLLSLLCLFIYHKMSSERTKNHANKSGGANGFSLKQLKDSFNTKKSSGKLRVTIAIMDYKLLEEATSNFHERNVLGKSSYGRVYKAKLDDNHYVAVKKVDDNTQQAQRQFENEVMILSKIQHQNVITLTGYCIHGSSRFLVYQLMENGSLETHLHGTSKGSTLTWHIRLKIALDIARGLEYLHEHCNPPIIHRDLKSSNILLDSKFNAKLSDFNFAITDGPHSKNNIKLLGTLGYVAPEYLLDGNLTEKSDVYAFGVILLELLLGRKPMEKLSPSQCQSIVTWAMPQMADRSKLPNIVDPVIRATMDSKHLYQVAAVAVLCVQPEPSYRPLITDVLHSLAPLVPVELGGTLRVNHRASLAVSAAFT